MRPNLHNPIRKFDKPHRTFNQYATKIKLYSYAQDFVDLFLSLAILLSANKSKFKTLRKFQLIQQILLTCTMMLFLIYLKIHSALLLFNE